MAKNLKELNEILKNYIGTALILTQWDIREILEKKVEEYYDEYQPVLYERTWKLRNSLQCSNIKFEKKGVSCTDRKSMGQLLYRNAIHRRSNW